MSHKILIVDDSATTRAFIRRSIKVAGFTTDAIHEAADGAAALAILATEPIDLVVADLHMPTMDGVEMTRRILADDVLKNIPVVVVSADPNTERLERLRESGIKGYVRKPFTPEALRNVLAPILGGNDV
jgi:two-component system chemotaxis response regulator CheY